MDLDTVTELIQRGRLEDAYSLCLRLGEAGSRAAQLRLGWIHQTGKGVQKDLDEAKRWYSRAIHSESAQAEFYIASVYWENRDVQQTIEWLEQSAAKAYPPALFELGRMYKAGYGIATDAHKGLAYLERAAGRGHLFARREIAREMLKGRHGWQKVPLGFLEMLNISWTGFLVARQDLYDDRTLTLRRHMKRDI